MPKPAEITPPPTRFITTIYLRAPMRERLDDVASQLERSRSWVITEALKAYLPGAVTVE